MTISPEVRATIGDGTYPGFAEEAVGLHERIRLTLPLYDEPVTFGDHALDVGSRDGRHHSMIKAFGPSSVTAIEPDLPDISRGVRFGIVHKNEIFHGTLEGWVQQHPPADSAFLLNMLPRLASNFEFLSALGRAVRVGGVAIISCIEERTNRNLVTTLKANPKVGLRPVVIPGARYHQDGLGSPLEPGKRNRFLSIWRRE